MGSFKPRLSGRESNCHQATDVIEVLLKKFALPKTAAARKKIGEQCSRRKLLNEHDLISEVDPRVFVSRSPKKLVPSHSLDESCLKECQNCIAALCPS